MPGVSEAVFLILASLADEPRHGYAILRDIHEVSGGRVRMSTGTLYGAIRRLIDRGWIERFEEPDPSRDRQAYRLTEGGRALLASEADRMQNLARVARARLAEVQSSEDA